MPLETGVTWLGDLNAAWPLGTDPKEEGDNHLRNIKTALIGSFPGMLAPNSWAGPLSVGNGTANSHAFTKKQVSDQLNKALGDMFNLDAIDGPNVRISFGAVQGSNGAVLYPGTGDWSATRPQGGRWVITFQSHNENSAFPVIVSPITTNPGAVLATAAASVSQVTVRGETSGGVAADVDFCFVRFCISTNF